MTEIKRFHEGGYGTTEMKLSDYGGWVLYDDHAEILAAKDARISELVSREQWHSQRTASFDILNRKYIDLQEQVRALTAEKENARDVMLYAANNIAYGIFNLSDKKLSDLKRGLSDTTCPTDSALLAERELRSFAARIRSGEQP